MRVDAEIVGLGESELKSRGKYMMHMGFACQAVNHVIRRFRFQPFSFVNLQISGVGAWHKGKSSNGLSFFFHDVTVPETNVIFKKICDRVAICPLVHVAAFAHLLSATLNQFEYDSQVFHSRMSYLSCCLHFEIVCAKLRVFPVLLRLF